MTITRGAIAPGKRQANWGMREDILEWLGNEARRRALRTRSAAANFWLTRIRTGDIRVRDTDRSVVGEFKMKHTNWRVWQADYDWLVEEAKKRGLDGPTGAVNFWLARCMNGEVFIQETHNV